ncbi:MAG: hypothetical protein WAU77_08715 [Solirubrobacteraceae bacterium]
MTSINNPAGRLYLLLTRLRNMNGDRPLIDTWSDILGEPPALVREHLGAVAELVTQIDAAATEPGRERVAAPVARYRDQWLQAIFPLERPFKEATANVRPSDEAHEALGLVAAILEAVAPDEAIPSEEDRTALVEQLQALVEEVTSDEELPEEVAHLIVARLTEIEVAFHHIEIGGPEAIRHATDALMGAAVASSAVNEKTRNASVIKNVMAVAGSIYVLFAAGPAIQKSLEAWPVVVQEITARHVVSVPHTSDTNGIVDAEVVEAQERHEGDKPLP